MQARVCCSLTAKKFLVLSIVLILCAGIFSGCMDNVRPLEAKPSHGGNLNGTDKNGFAKIQELTGVRLFGVSEAPFLNNAIKFEALNEANYKYTEFKSKAEIPAFAPGDKATGWKSIANGGVISATTAKNIVVAAVDENDVIQRLKTFYFVPGVNYYSLEGSTYLDVTGEEPQEKYYVSGAARAIAQTMLNTAKNDYTYGIGKALFNYLEQYTSPEALAGAYKAGISFEVAPEQNIYAPISGEIIAVGNEQSMNKIAIYNATFDLTLILLHCSDITPATELYNSKTAVKAGELLGYGGQVGGPVGFEQVHMEVLDGRQENYYYASADLDTLRKYTYDPRILSDLGTLPVIDDQKPAPTILGNSSGNVNAKGMVARLDDSIIFVNDNDGGRMYKLGPDDAQPVKITDDKVTSLAASEGYIYYSNLSDKGNLYRIRPDGTERTMLFKGKCDYITVVNNLIYFRNYSDNSGLYCVELDGSNPTRLNRNLSWMMAWGGDKLYLAYGSDRIFAAELKTDEEGKLSAEMVKITENRGWYLVILEDWIYYTNGNEKNAIYKVKKDGTENQVVLNEGAEFLNYHEGWLYYSSLKEEQRIFRVRLDGSAREQVTADPYSSDINIIGHYLYYRVGNSGQYRKNIYTGEVTKADLSD